MASVSCLGKAAVGLAANVVEGVEEEAAGATGRVENEVSVTRIQYLHGEGYKLARCEVLAEIAFEESSHELLEGDALGVEVGAVEGYTFEVLHALGENRRVDGDGVGEHAGFTLLLNGVEAFDALGEPVSGLSITALELVWLPVRYIRVFLVKVLYEDELGELSERHDGASASAFPEGLVTLSNGGAQLFAWNGGEVLPGLVLVEAPRGWVAVAVWECRKDGSCPARGKESCCRKCKQAPGESGDSAAELGAQTGAVAAGLLNGLGRTQRQTHWKRLHSNYEPVRVFSNGHCL